MSSSSKLHGTFSKQMFNRTDNKWSFISQQVMSLFNFKLSTLKTPIFLVDTLYYTINTTEQLTFIPIIQENSP